VLFACASGRKDRDTQSHLIHIIGSGCLILHPSPDACSLQVQTVTCRAWFAKCTHDFMEQTMWITFAAPASAYVSDMDWVWPGVWAVPEPGFRISFTMVDFGLGGSMLGPGAWT
jgi:hypothetical protein